MDISSIHRETGVAWNEIADRYSHGSRDEAEVIAFLRGGGNYLFESERQILGDLRSWCRRAIHLQCSGGLDALSLLRQGAGEVVGVDISEQLLASARRKAAAIDAAATWYQCDVLNTPNELNGTADLVYTGKGALCWMMDLPAWAEVASRLLAPGGRLFIYEAHPLNWVWDTEAEGYTLDPKNGNYFSNAVKEGLPVDGSSSVARHRQWTMSQIINSVISAGLKLEQLHEYPEPFWNEFPNMSADTLHRLPHAYALLASKV